MGCHFLLQGIFSTQGSNLCFLLWQVDSLPQSHQGNRNEMQLMCFRNEIIVCVKEETKGEMKKYFEWYETTTQQNLWDVARAGLRRECLHPKKRGLKSMSCFCLPEKNKLPQSQQKKRNNNEARKRPGLFILKFPLTST